MEADKISLKLSKVKFGTDGIRGTFGKMPITEDVAFSVGYSIAKMIGGKIMISRDTRPSGLALQKSLSDGILLAGGTPFITGVLPTSGMATALSKSLADAGIMITASHNPFYDNGFKILLSGGLKLNSEQENALEVLINETINDLDELKKINYTKSKTIISEEAKYIYESSLLHAMGDLSNFSGKKIAIDLANGAGSMLKDFLIQNIPSQIYFVESQSEINEGCGSEYPSKLQAVVLENGCDAGIAIDGDGDRCLLIDECGKIISGDSLAYGLISSGGYNSAAITVMSNAAMEGLLPGISVIRTDVGDKNLLQEVMAGRAEIGCEESGHVVFSDALPTGDGIITGIRALSQAFKDGLVSDHFGRFSPFPRKVGKIPFSRKIQIPEFDTSILGDGGRIFIRYSGTEPVIRILVEGQDSVSVDKCFSNVTSTIEELLRNSKE